MSISAIIGGVWDDFAAIDIGFNSETMHLASDSKKKHFESIEPIIELNPINVSTKPI